MIFIQKLKTTFFLIAIITIGRNLFSATTSSSLILTLPYNANQLTVGNAAHLQGFDGMFTNPASTMYSTEYLPYHWQLGLSFFQLVQSIKYFNIGYTQIVSPKYGNFGIGLTYLGYGSFSISDENGSAAGDVQAYDIVLVANYSVKIPWNILLGTNIKYIHNKLHIFTANNVAFDLGLKREFRFYDHELWIAASVNNMGPDTKFFTEGSPLPLSVNTALSYSFTAFLPKWVDIITGTYYEYFKEGYFSYALNGEIKFSFLDTTLYVNGKYSIGGLELGNWSVGGGGSYQFYNIRGNLSLGFNPFQSLGNSLFFSAKVSYWWDRQWDKKPQIIDDYGKFSQAIGDRLEEKNDSTEAIGDQLE